METVDEAEEDGVDHFDKLLSRRTNQFQSSMGESRMSDLALNMVEDHDFFNGDNSLDDLEEDLEAENNDDGPKDQEDESTTEIKRIEK